MQQNFRNLLIVAIVLTIASGLMYGNLTQRWGPPAPLVAAGNHVRSFPEQIGDWRLADDRDMDDSVQQMLQCAGYVNRDYVHQGTGQTVGVAIIVGPPGPTAVHTPEICYSSRSFNLANAGLKKEVPGQEESFWGTSFESRYAGAQKLQVYHAWNNGEIWEASERPRIKFGGNQLLYKVQISGEVGSGMANELQDPAWEFATALCESTWTPRVADFE